MGISHQGNKRELILAEYQEQKSRQLAAFL
jgi:hypothetical protein